MSHLESQQLLAPKKVVLIQFNCFLKSFIQKEKHIYRNECSFSECIIDVPPAKRYICRKHLSLYSNVFDKDKAMIFQLFVFKIQPKKKHDNRRLHGRKDNGLEFRYLPWYFKNIKNVKEVLEATDTKAFTFKHAEKLKF